MTYFIAVLVLVFWVALTIVMMRRVLSAPSCPECEGSNIRAVDLRTSTIIVDGSKVPAAWLYRCCRDCGARLKWDVGRATWVELTPNEWAEVVENAEEVP